MLSQLEAQAINSVRLREESKESEADLLNVDSLPPNQMVEESKEQIQR